MRLVSLIILMASALTLEAQPRDIDLTRLRDTEWDLVPIVTLDSSRNKDTLAVRRIQRVFYLAPGRIVFEGRTTDGNDWAIFSWVNGTTRRLAVSDREFFVPDGKKKRIYDRFWHYGGAGTYAASVTVEKRTPMPNYVYATDGETWRHVIRDEDTVMVSGERMVVGAAAVRAVLPDGSVLIGASFKSPKTMGLLRATETGLERILMKSDTIPGVQEFETAYGLWQTFGINSGLKTFEPANGGWFGILRTHEGGRNYIDRVLVKPKDGSPRVVVQTDSFSFRNNQGDSLVFAALSPNDDVIAQRKQTVGIVPRGGSWRPILDKDTVGGTFALTDVAWLDDTSSRALFTVTQLQSSGQGVMMAMLPGVFYFDGTRAVQQLKSEIGPTRIFSNMRPLSALRRVPGLRGAIVDLIGIPIGKRALSAWYFDPATKSFSAVPAFRTKSGDVGLQALVGWNGENEAIVRYNGGLAVVRR